jgi:hypothetical protein
MIVSLSGKKGSGKSTVTTLIERNSKKMWVSKQFAGKLKRMTAELLGCTLYDLENWHFKETEIDWLGTTPRAIMQTLGGDWGREMIHPDIWVKSLLADYKRDYQMSPDSFDQPTRTGAYPNWLISDCRYLNECEGIKKLGGLVIRINRNTNSTDTHPSETALDNYTDWDYVIDNNGTLEELKEKVKIMCLELDL